MNIIKAILLLLLLSLLIPYSADAANFVAASASRADVATAIASATYGDTITVPQCAAGDCVWTSGIEITKDINIIGSGIDSTILTLGFTDNQIFEAFFKFTPDATSRSRLNQLSGEGTFQVAGFMFAGNNRMQNKFGTLIYNMNTTAIRRVKIHNNKYTSIHRAVQSRGNVYGVFYNNQLISTNASYPLGYGLDSWNNNAMSLGSGDGWYVEGNTFSFDGNGTVSGGGQGMGHVVRYNSVTGSHNIYVESHGNQPSFVRGTQITEIYGNNFASTPSQSAIDLRGGKGMVFFNKVNTYYFCVREEYNDTLSGVPMNNACPEDGPQICLDNCVSMKVNHTYLFNNRHILDSSIIPFPIREDRYDGVNANVPPELVENREFWQQYSTGTFDGTGRANAGGGVGCGTLAEMNAINPGSGQHIGVGFWVTDQSCSDLTDLIGANPTTPISGTLYRWSGSEWVAYYTPYQYPHPLTASDPPQNLHIVQ